MNRARLRYQRRDRRRSTSPAASGAIQTPSGGAPGFPARCRRVAESTRAQAPRPPPQRHMADELSTTRPRPRCGQAIASGSPPPMQPPFQRQPPGDRCNHCLRHVTYRSPDRRRSPRQPELRRIRQTAVEWLHPQRYDHTTRPGVPALPRVQRRNAEGDGTPAAAPGGSYARGVRRVAPRPSSVSWTPVAPATTGTRPGLDDDGARREHHRRPDPTNAPSATTDRRPRRRVRRTEAHLRVAAGYPTVGGAARTPRTSPSSGEAAGNGGRGGSLRPDADTAWWCPLWPAPHRRGGGGSTSGIAAGASRGRGYEAGAPSRAAGDLGHAGERSGGGGRWTPVEFR